MNTVFDEMTISADMKDDADFEARLMDGTYQFTVTHFQSLYITLIIQVLPRTIISAEAREFPEKSMFPLRIQNAIQIITYPA